MDRVQLLKVAKKLKATILLLTSKSPEVRANYLTDL